MIKTTQNEGSIRNKQVNVISALFSVINVTLPDEKQNYIHRIGRVGRAERFVFFLAHLRA